MKCIRNSLVPKVMALSEMNTPPEEEELEDTQQSLTENEFRPQSVQFCTHFSRGRLYDSLFV